MLRIEINGVPVEAEEGSTIIEVADKLAIPIPRFCYHKKLSVAANCRMCLVQVEKSNKTLPACATPIVEGMKVWTASKEAVTSQKAVMEFLLINHPLDCPICDQGGECELQDVSMQYGNDRSRFNEPKRVVTDPDLGPLIATDMTRCIQCTRCVRFGEEIAGQRELGALGRGEDMHISTYIQQTVNSEVSGNIIDLCPVGALTSKPFRFRARAWELNEHFAVSPHDCMGSNLYLHTRNQEVMRVVPKENENINETWISDRDRFSYQALQHEDRVRKPLVRKHENWHAVSWQEALKYAVAGLKLCIDSYGAQEFGVLAGPNATVEEYYLLQKFTRALGSGNIDHRLRQVDFRDQDLAATYPNLGVTLQELEACDGIFLIASNIHKEQPLLGTKIRKIANKGAKICSLSAADYAYNFETSAKIVVNPNEYLAALSAIAKALLEIRPAKIAGADALLQKVNVGEQERLLAQQLASGKQTHIVLGLQALMHPQASVILNLTNLIAQILHCKIGVLSDGANAAGAYLAGCLPHRAAGGAKISQASKTAKQMLEQPLKCYLLFAFEPEYDSIFGSQAFECIKQADFVIVLSSYQSKTLLELADVILPISAFAESEGTRINFLGDWQTYAAAVQPFAESRPAWKVLRVLANFLGLAGFEYVEADQVLTEIRALTNLENKLPAYAWQCPDQINFSKTTGITRLAPISLYAADPILRRASALQATEDAHDLPNLGLNPTLAKKLNLAQGDLAKVSAGQHSIELSVKIDNRLADSTVEIYQANRYSNSLPASYHIVEVSKC